MIHNNHYRMAFILALVGCAIVSTVALASGNSFIIGDLRVDLPVVYNAHDYRVHLYANSLPATGDIRNFATAWLGVFLGEYDGSTGSGQFSQVGLRLLEMGYNGLFMPNPECFVIEEAIQIQITVMAITMI